MASVVGQAGAGRRLARAALDLLYPPACVACAGAVEGEAGLCAACFRDTWFISGPACGLCGAPEAEGLCDACRHAPPSWDRGRAAALYEGAARRMALSLKHGDRLDVAPVAASWMARAGAELIAEADLIAPVPLHWRRLLGRRFNQSAELARALCRRTGRMDAFAPDLLRRTRATPSQEGRSRDQRLANVAGAIEVRRRRLGAAVGRRILLIDDVMTTGATLSACAEALRAAGAAGVDTLALARVARGADATM